MQDRATKLLELLDTHSRTLHSLLLRLTLRHDIAEDLMQELFIKLSDSQAFDKAANHLAYACRTAINLAFDWRRKNRPALCPPTQSDYLGSHENSPLSKLIQSEQIQQILNAMEKLKTTSRQICVLHYIQQESYQDIARQLGKTPHQTRALCAKALTKLRKLLDHDQMRLSDKETRHDQ